MLALWGCLAAMAGAPLQGLEVTPGGFRTSYDVTVHVRSDGALFVEDQLVLDVDLPQRLDAVAKTRAGEPRVVVSADPAAPYSRVVEVLDMVQQTYVVDRVALEIGDAEIPEDPLSPVGSREVEDLDDDVFQGELTRPQRHKYPQNPYQCTDFTAYTREFGEAKLGLASMSYGVLPRIQLGTSPALDVLGAYNLNGKGNFLRLGKFDMALTSAWYLVPITDLLRATDVGGRYRIAGFKLKNQDIFVDEITFATFALQSSMQVYSGWSLHAGFGYSRASAKGNIDLGNLPTLVLPGLRPIGGNKVTAVPKVVAEALDLRFATDYRFNRRDTLILQFATTFYGTVRGAISGDLSGTKTDYGNYALALAYKQYVPVADAYRTSVAWQFSWERVDLRFGVGSSAVSRTWWLQAFDLSYRIGGSTRRVEKAVRKQYQKDVEIHENIDEGTDD
jgi:hypothetical protein